MPVSARQLEAWHPPNVTGNVWNPIAFTEGKQADKQRQPVGLQTGQTEGAKERERWRYRLAPNAHEVKAGLIWWQEVVVLQH